MITSEPPACQKPKIWVGPRQALLRVSVIDFLNGALQVITLNQSSTPPLGVTRLRVTRLRVTRRSNRSKAAHSITDPRLSS